MTQFFRGRAPIIFDFFFHAYSLFIMHGFNTWIMSCSISPDLDKDMPSAYILRCAILLLQRNSSKIWINDSKDGIWKNAEAFLLETCFFDVSVLTFERWVWNVKTYFALYQTSIMKSDSSLIKPAFLNLSYYTFNQT